MTAKTQPQSRFLDVNGLRLHYLDWGSPRPGAPAIVCMHGFVMNAHWFDGFARHFCDRFHIISTDIRGHGDSAWAADGAYQYTDHLADLAGTVDALGLDRFTLIGSSLGGKVGLMYLSEHPERVERLVLNDVGPDSSTNYAVRAPTALPRPRSFVAPEEALPYLQHTMPVFTVLPQDEQREQAGHMLRLNAEGAWVWKMDAEPIRQRRAAGHSPVTPDLWPVVRGLRCPAMLVWGQESHMLSGDHARRIVDAMPDGRLVAVPGSGHVPWLTEPEAAAALEEFLVRPE